MQTCYSDLDTERKLLGDLKNKSQQLIDEIGAYENTVSKVQKFAVPMKKNMPWQFSYQMRILQLPI